jgi:hypothetical protein
MQNPSIITVKHVITTLYYIILYYVVLNCPGTEIVVLFIITVTLMTELA